MFEEEKHPRDSDGKFAEKKGAKNSGYDSRDDIGTIKNAAKKKTPTPKTVKIDMDADIQKQFDNASPKERQKIAFDYIMKNLRGKYPAEDGRVVAIEKIGAKKITHDRGDIKIRVVPKLGELIQSGNFIESKDADHKIFKGFAYYKVHFQFRDEIYSAILNVGIRENGDSTLYEINQFNKNK